ncbi:MAG TPA: shikimate kinase [Phycisphaerae bacterium]|nr:shikimate kinase [Phycisphaerae bacterium]
MNIVLIGHRGSGKSTVGQLAAKRLGWRFTDTDQMIMEEKGKTIKELFDQLGEQGFRRIERKVLESLRKAKNRVISVGGGAITDPDNCSLLKRIGRVVWLRAPASILWARICQDPHSAKTRPDLTAAGGLAEIEKVLQEREPIYEGLAHQTIDTMTMDPEEVAVTIEMWFRANDMESA